MKPKVSYNLGYFIYY